MLLLTCPFCRWPLLLPDHRLGLTHRCVNCGEEYDTSKVSDAAQLSLTTSKSILPNMGVSPRRATAQDKPKTPTASGLLSQLTSPHLCQHCEGPLEAIGRRRATATCPTCQRPASVHAVLYNCSNCGELLESPARQKGQLTRCPACSEQLTVPSDILFNDAREEPDGTWFEFPCPWCRTMLRSKQCFAGTTAVCPHGLHTFAIPHSGDPISTPADLTHDPREVLHRYTERRCRNCGLSMPSTATRCPHCDRQYA